MIIFYGVTGLIFLEIAVFALVAGSIGFFTALLLCFVAGIAGAYLVQQQGLGMLMNLRGSFDRGEMPLDDAFDAACIMAAGILMIIPGFVSDIVGFALLIPQVRKYLRVFMAQRHGHQGGSFTPDNGIIDADFVVVRDDPSLPPDNKDR